MKSKFYLTILFIFTSSIILLAQNTNNEPVILIPVKQQLEAYNSRDIDKFCSAFSDTIKVSRDGVLSYQGMGEFKKRYDQMFINTPDLHCEIVNRIVTGNVVIDHEKVQRKKGEPRFDAIAVYRIKGDKIVEVNFISPEKN